MIQEVGDEDVSGAVDGHAVGELKLSSAAAKSSKRLYESAFGRELLNPVVAGVCNEHVALGVHGETERRIQLTFLVSASAEVKDEAAVPRELLDAMIHA